MDEDTKVLVFDDDETGVGGTSAYNFRATDIQKTGLLTEDTDGSATSNDFEETQDKSCFSLS